MHNLSIFYNTIIRVFSDGISVAKDDPVLGISYLVFMAFIFIFLGVITISVICFSVCSVFVVIRNRLNGTTKNMAIKYEKSRAKMAGLLDALGASGKGNVRILEYPEHSIKVKYDGGRYYDHFIMTVDTAISGYGSFSITLQKNKSWITDFFALKMRLRSVIETADVRFNSRFRIVTNGTDFSKAYFKAYFDSAEKRDAVQTLFTKGCRCNDIRLNKTGLHANWSVNAGGYDSAEFLNRSIKSLMVLAE